MSGQPYRYYTDPTKYRTMFMETLDLQANINAMNLEANKTYRETGQLPAVSQMKDNRTTSEILADNLKLKTDLISAIAKVSSQQFGQLVVQRLETNPLNIDNKFLIFTAQRIDDIVANLKKIYKYGISGDSHDVEQFIKFVEKMYNDKNSMAAQTKNFMESQGVRSLSASGNSFINLMNYLANLRTLFLKQNKKIAEMENKMFGTIDVMLDEFFPQEESLRHLLTMAHTKSAQLTSVVNTIMEVIPNSQDELTFLEREILKVGQIGGTESAPPAPGRRGQIAGVPSGLMSFISEDSTIERNQIQFEELTKYFDYLNSSVPQIGLIASSESQIQTYFEQLETSFSKQLLPIIIETEKRRDADYFDKMAINSGLLKAIVINVKKLLEVYERMYSILIPNGDKWSENEIKQLKPIMDDVRAQIKNLPKDTKILPFPSVSTSTTSSMSSLPTLSSTTSMASSTTASTTATVNDLRQIKRRIQELLDIHESQLGLTAEEINEAIDLLQELYDLDNAYDFRILDPNEPLDQIVNEMETAIQQLGINGVGLQKRRGRPKGCGINKPKTYKEIVKKHSALDKGIIETPRFVKFGKYLVNTHRLNNEDVFALKRPSGGNIVEIPSQKLSKNLSSVIKKMLGGELPTYSDISKLSEPEKAYLHKVSKKSNILDKFDIPAPSKDAFEKDIHQFEVMKGEILAGNDNKELIQKFKAHILKLSKSGALPKREVHEILEDLLELNC